MNILLENCLFYTSISSYISDNNISLLYVVWFNKMFKLQNTAFIKRTHAAREQERYTSWFGCFYFSFCWYVEVILNILNDSKFLLEIRFVPILSKITYMPYD